MLDATLAVLTTPGRNLPGPLEDGLRDLLVEPNDVVSPLLDGAPSSPAAPQLVLEVLGDRIVDASPHELADPAPVARGRTRLVVTRPYGDPTALPPRLERVFASAGLDVAGHRLKAHDHARYRTQKLVLLLTPPGAAEPTVVVKLTRDPIDNHRLENEARALRELDLPTPHVLPLLAAGHLDGRAFVALPAVSGPSLRSSGAAGRTGFLDTLDLAVHLASTTAHTPPHDPAPVLDHLVDRFVTTAMAPRRIERVLRSDVERLGAGPLPAVASHGDLGTWNVVLDPVRGAVVLDWEASERHAPPLWDLLYLHRSWVLDRRGARGTRLVDVLEDDLTGRAVRRAITSVLDATGTPATLVPSLYRLCWVHRAVKATTRQRRSRRRRGYALAALEAARLSDEQLLAGLLDVPAEV